MALSDDLNDAMGDDIEVGWDDGMPSLQDGEWYNAVISGVQVQPGKSDPTKTLLVVEFGLQGRRLRSYFVTKGPGVGFLLDLLTAIGMTKEGNPRIRPTEMVGAEVLVKVERDANGYFKTTNYTVA